MDETHRTSGAGQIKIKHKIQLYPTDNPHLQLKVKAKRNMKKEK